MQVSGEVGPLEWFRVTRLAAWRPVGLRVWLALPIFLVGWTVCVAAGWALASALIPDQTSSSWTTAWVAITIVLGLAGARLYSMWFRSLLGKALAARASYPAPLTWEVEPDALRVMGEVSDTRILWRGIDEIAPMGGQWVFYSGSAVHYLPRRLFADRRAERAFIGAALERLTDIARARSSQAVAFVGASAA